MIARPHRFHGHGSLRYAYSRGTTIRGSLCILKYIPNSRQSTWRAAVVVSRKVHKSAVVRNRIRRRMYEIIRLQMSEAAPPVDMVFIVHAEQAATIPAEELEQSLTAQLKKAGMV